MAELEIRLEVDPVTRKKNVVIEYLSDDDALPMEHEDEHRRLVDQLIAGGAIKAQELGKIQIERKGEVAQETSNEAETPAVERLSEDA